jgi:hypothetical protein
MVFVKFRAVVEGIYEMKTNTEVLFSPHRASLRQSFIGLFRKTKTSDFVRKVAETFLTRILLIGIGLITSVIVARVLGPEGRGLYAVAATIAAMGVQLGNLGLHASNTYYVAQKPELLPFLMGNTLIASFVQMALSRSDRGNFVVISPRIDSTGTRLSSVSEFVNWGSRHPFFQQD